MFTVTTSFKTDRKNLYLCKTSPFNHYPGLRFWETTSGHLHVKK